MENILINFESDPSGLQPGIDGLVQLEVVDKKVADQAKKTAAAIQDRDKKLSQGATASKSSIESLAGSFQKLDKSIVGGTYKKVFEELRSQLNLSNKELKSFYETLIKNSREGIVTAKTKEDVAVLTELLNSAQQALADLGEQEEVTGKKTQSLRARIREAKEELVAMAEAGLQGTPQFEALRQKAGQLDDEIRDLNQEIKNVGSDTRNIEGLISVMSGSVGVFSAAQGAVALFGDENEDLQKALLKVNAAMSILNGIQAIQALLQKQSAGYLLVQNALQKINILQTYLQAAAESQYTVVRYGAIAAQRILNAVMAANPVGILLVAVGALAGALLYFTSNAKDAAKAQNELNNVLDGAGKYLDADIKGIENSNKKVIASLKSRGASDDELTTQELRNINIKTEARKNALKDIQKALNDEKLLNKLKEGDFEKLQAKETELMYQLKDDETEVLTIRSENERKHYLESLKSASAFAEARVLISRKGSRDELNAQIESIKAKRDEELKSNPNLTTGEKVKIEAEANRQIKDLRFSFEKAALEDAKKAIDARVLKSKEGSRQELDYRIEQLAKQMDIDLKDQTLTQNKKLLIEETFQRNKRDLIRSYNKQVAEDTINDRIAEANAEISGLTRSSVDENNTYLIAAKKKLIDEQAALEIIGIQNSINSEKTKADQIKAINEKSFADKVALDEKAAKADIEFSNFIVNNVIEKYKQEQLLILANTNLSTRERKKAIDKIRIAEDEALANRKTTLELELKNNLITYREYYKQKAEIENNQAELERLRSLEDTQTREAKEKLIIETSTSAISMLKNALFEKNRANNAAELAQVEALHNKKAISEQEYQNRVKKIKRQQAIDEKKAAIFEILIQQGPMIAQGFAKGNIPGAIAAAGLFALQLALTVARPIPEFFKGTKKAPAGFKWVGEKGPELIYDQGGYPIIPHHKSKQLAENNFYDHKILNDYNIPNWSHNISLPEISEGQKVFIEKHIESGRAEIDYDRLGKSVAIHVGKLSDLVIPGTSVSIDDNGIHILVKKRNETIEYQNKRYST